MKKKKKKTALKKQHMISTMLHSAKVKTDGDSKDIGDCPRLGAEGKSKRLKRGKGAEHKRILVRAYTVTMVT